MKKTGFFDEEEDFHEDYDLELNVDKRLCDDSSEAVNVQHQVSSLMEAIARVGGEVCRLRSEMDELLEQNTQLLHSFGKLREVILEKGEIDLDDFQLACDVMGTPSDLKNLQPIKKFAN